MKERGYVSSKKMIEGNRKYGYKGLKVVIHSETDDEECDEWIFDCFKER